METNILTGWDAVLAGRKTGIYYLHDQEPLALKLTRVLSAVAAELGGELAEAKKDPSLEGFVKLDDPNVIGKVLALFIQTHEASRGPGITLRRITKTENDQIKAECQKERLKRPNGEWYEKLNDDDFEVRRLAVAIVEPEVPGSTRDEKAAWVRENLSAGQIRELSEACVDLDGFNLRRIEEKVKN